MGTGTYSTRLLLPHGVVPMLVPDEGVGDLVENDVAHGFGIVERREHFR